MEQFYVKIGAKALDSIEGGVSVCYIHSCECLELELKCDTPKKGIYYFKLAHYMNVRNMQLKIIDGFRFKYGLKTRKTTNSRILRIVFPKP